MSIHDYFISTRFPCRENVVSDGPYLVPQAANLHPDRPVTLLFKGLQGPVIDVDEPDQRIEHGEINKDFTLRWRRDPRKPHPLEQLLRRIIRFFLRLGPEEPPAPAFLADITVQPTHLFADLDPDRRQLRRSFAGFRHRLEDLDDRGVLAPGAADVIMTRIAMSLPLRLDELLFFRYGLETELRCVDLHPGMHLQIDFGGYQYVAPPEFAGGFHNGFVGQGRCAVTLGRTADGMLTFNRFLDTLAPIQIDTSGNPIGNAEAAARGNDLPGGSSPITYVTNVLDLEADGHRRRHARLVYPSSVPPADHILQRDALGNHPVVIAADTWADLDRATEHYVVSGETVAATTDQRAIRYFVFAGRSIAIPEILITHGGQRQFVPLGTRLKDLIEEHRLFPTDPAPGFTQGWSLLLYAWLTKTSTKSPMPSLRRQNHPAFIAEYPIDDPRNGVGSVAFEHRTLRAGDTGLQQWDLPLWAGDVVDDALTAPNRTR